MHKLMKLYALGIQILVKHIGSRSILTIEEFILVKFEESNTLVKNVVKIDFLGEDMKQISLKDSSL